MILNTYLKVRKDNAKFSIELKEYELCQLGDLASEIYNTKFQYVNEFVRRYRDQNKN